MELEGILAAGCERTLKEFTTVKSDATEGKRDLALQLIKTGEYNLPDDNHVEGRTKKVVDVILDFDKY